MERRKRIGRNFSHLCHQCTCKCNLNYSTDVFLSECWFSLSDDWWLKINIVSYSRASLAKVCVQTCILNGYSFSILVVLPQQKQMFVNELQLSQRVILASHNFRMEKLPHWLTNSHFCFAENPYFQHLGANIAHLQCAAAVKVFYNYLGNLRQGDGLVFLWVLRLCLSSGGHGGWIKEVLRVHFSPLNDIPQTGQELPRGQLKVLLHDLSEFLPHLSLHFRNHHCCGHQGPSVPASCFW